MACIKIVKSAVTRLNAGEIADKLKLLNNTFKDGSQWQLQEYNLYPSIQKKFILRNFEATSSFIQQINMRSHLYGHHPTVQYTYNNVSITLQTHDVQGISEIDFMLAKRVNDYAKHYR